jgi:hypothetical protein
MLGWHISVYKLADGGHAPATAESPRGAQLAEWQAHLDGLDWIFQLVGRGEALALEGGGYPSLFTAPAGRVLPTIIAGPPEARETWVCGATDVLTDKWRGRTSIDRAAIEGCSPEEWLLVVAWDES